MKIEQISVFLENKTGRINDLAHTLSSANINMNAFSLAESSDFGIMRIIVSNTELAVEVLRKNGFMVSITDVICVKIGNHPGAMATTLDSLTANDIFIEYMYAFSQVDSAYVVLRPNNIDIAIKTLTQSGQTLLSKSEIL